MRLSRTDFVPLMSIVAGGVIGASLSIGLLGRSPSGDVPVPYPVVEPSLTPVLAVRVQFSDGGPVITAASIEVNGMVVTPVVEPSVTQELRIRTEGSDGAVITSVSLAYDGMVITPVKCARSLPPIRSSRPLRPQRPSGWTGSSTGSAGAPASCWNRRAWSKIAERG